VILLILLCIAALIIAFDTQRWGISPMPTSRKAKKIILELAGEGEVYELGSGFGSLAFSLSRRGRVKAYEMALIPYLISKMLPSKNLKITRKDFFKESLSDAKVIVCYLYPGAMARLKEKFKKELQEGAIVISNSFCIPGWKPTKVIEVGDFFRSEIYLYSL